MKTTKEPLFQAERTTNMKVLEVAYWQIWWTARKPVWLGQGEERWGRQAVGSKLLENIADLQRSL